MSTPTRTLRPPKTFINGLEKTDEYLHMRARHRNRRKAIGHAATIHAERMKSSEIKNPSELLDRQALTLLATLPKFVVAQHELDKLRDQERKRGRKYPREVRLPHIKSVIKYNHALRELVDTFPDLNADNIRRFSAAAMLDLGTPEEAEYCAERTREALHGMRYEIGLEQVLWHIEDVEDISHATEEQELSGIDLIVTYRGHKLYLDAKASEFGEQKTIATRHSFQRAHHMTEADEDGGFPVWCGLNEEDFDGGFRAREARAGEEAARVQQILDSLVAQRTAVA